MRHSCQTKGIFLNRYRYPSTLCVAAADREYKKWLHSNYGKAVGVIAPSVQIPSTWADSDNSYREANGTSMATPFAAGVIAIYVGYEGDKINFDASQVYNRINTNMLTGITTRFPKNPSDFHTANNFLQTGINAQKNPNDPFMGNGPTAIVTKDMRRSFPIKFGLMVRVGGQSLEQRK
ncbi:hypothetical protein B7463_g11365, partial [Scytalidium lignicola]